MSYKATEVQLQLSELLASVPHVLAFGGSRSGKTFQICWAVVQRALMSSGSFHAIFRFAGNACVRSIGMDTLPAVLSTCFPNVPYTLNKSEWIFEFPNGSKIFLAGLDDQERTEKILGLQFITIYLCECSQISKESRDVCVTRLAQICTIDATGEPLSARMYYDENPPEKTHWTHRIFVEKKSPETRMPLPSPERYAAIRLNPDQNRENLPASYFDELAALPEWRRRRFERGEFADANPNALFPEAGLDKWRTDGADLGDDWVRVVIGVDPSGASGKEGETNDAIGIVVMGLHRSGIGYVRFDKTLRAGPDRWAAEVVGLYDSLGADLICCESNFGGAMATSVIRNAAPGRHINIKMVNSSRGKMLRAEPVAVLMSEESGKIRLIGRFDELEEQMAAMSTSGYTGTHSPNNLDAMVFAATELFSGIIAPRRPPSQPTGQLSRMLDIPHGWSA
jgi:hypothetical protein